MTCLAAANNYRQRFKYCYTKNSTQCTVVPTLAQVYNQQTPSQTSILDTGNCFTALEGLILYSYCRLRKLPTYPTVVTATRHGETHSRCTGVAKIGQIIGSPLNSSPLPSLQIPSPKGTTGQAFHSHNVWATSEEQGCPASWE